MPLNHTQLHYAPSSVGGLMDPAFLRGAMSDAQGSHPATGEATMAPRWPRLCQAVLQVMRWPMGRRAPRLPH